MKIKNKILGLVSDLVSDLTYYDRKNDEDLSVEQFNEAVENGVVTIDEIVTEFRKHLNNVYSNTVLTGEEKHRAVLSIVNGCSRMQCLYYGLGKCNHENTTVDKLGLACCPLLETAIIKSEFNG